MSTTTASPKDRALDAIRSLPADATYEDAMETLYDLIRVERGVKRLDTDPVIPLEEARQRFENKWRA